MTAIKPILPLDGYGTSPLIHIAIRIDRLKIPNNFFFVSFVVLPHFFLRFRVSGLYLSRLAYVFDLYR